MAALASLLAAAPAQAASDGEVTALLAAPCPSEYRNVFQREWTSSEQAAALDGDFPVLQDRRSSTLIPPVDWEQDPYESLSWRHWLHTLGWWMDALFFIDRGGGANADLALARARDLTLDWIAQNPVAPPDANNPPWAPKPTADRAPYIAYLARRAACRGFLDAAEAEALLDSLRAHAAYLTGHHPPTTKGLWADYGLALTGQYLGGILPEASGWEALAVDRFKPAIGARLEPREHLWLNNSPNYQATLTHLVDLFHANVDPDPELAAIAARMRDALGWFVLPDGSLTRFGGYHTMVPLQPWVANAGDRHRGLRLMRRSGYAFVKRASSQLATVASYHHDSNKQADDLGFELYERRHRLIADSGHHDFDLSRWQAFARSARAHSVLTVDGREFPIRDRPYGGGIIAAGSGSGWYAILGQNPGLRRQGVRHHRLFVYRPGKQLLLVDIVRSRRAHVYRRHLQIGPEISARRSAREVLLAAAGLRARIRASGRGRPRIVGGRRRPLAGWLFPDSYIETARPTVTYRTRGRDANLLTEILIGSADRRQPRVLSASPRRVVLRLGRSARSRLSATRSGRRLLLRIGR